MGRLVSVPTPFGVADVSPDLRDTSQSTAPSNPTLALDVRNIRKVYGGMVALRDVSFTVRRGEIHALLGENGAGKSTIVRLLAAAEHADSGRFVANGTVLDGPFSARDVAHAGVAFIHQDFALIPDLSVAENIALAAGYTTRRGVISWKSTLRRAERILADMGSDLDPSRPLASLPMNAQAVVAIARAVAQDASLLVLDEPTANLSDAEAAAVHRMLLRLRTNGVSSMIISHRLAEVMALADRATVLRDGEYVDTVDIADTTKDRIVELMVGHAVETRRRPVSEPVEASGEARLELHGLETDEFGPVDMTIRAGRVTGLTGLAGAGHFEFAECLFGLKHITAGTLILDGARYRPANPGEATAAGLRMVPADRKADGAAPHMTLAENLNLNPLPWTLLRRREEHRSALNLLREFDVRPRRPAAEFATLSGGNAQKLILARNLDCKPKVLILCEPTAAVDINARRQIHDQLREAARSGTAVIVASTDTEELADLCDEVHVFKRGRLYRTLIGTDLDLQQIQKAVHSHV